MKSNRFYFKGILGKNPFETKKQRHKRIQREFKRDYEQFQLGKEETVTEHTILDKVKSILGL
mgnify:CR=1 FL=1